MVTGEPSGVSLTKCSRLRFDCEKNAIEIQNATGIKIKIAIEKQVPEVSKVLRDKKTLVSLQLPRKTHSRKVYTASLST